MPAPPPRPRATVAAGFVTGMLSGVRVRAARSAMLREAGIDPASLSARHARVPLESYALLYNATVRKLGDEGFGLFSRPVAAGTFEFLCRAIIGARTLAEALDRAARFLAIVLPDLRVAIVLKGAAAELQIVEARRLRTTANDPRRVFAFEWLLRLLHGLACWLVGRGLALERVRFPYPRPPHAADYALVYTEHSSFGGSVLVATMEASLLDMPVRRDETDLTAFLDGSPGKITMLYRRDRGIARQVRDILARDLRAAIASELGYSEPSAFFRAFHAWTGEAPSVHRRRLARPR